VIQRRIPVHDLRKHSWDSNIVCEWTLKTVVDQMHSLLFKNRKSAAQV
jgi:hypothetical protein